ncbi:MAG: M48 family metalloprotease [Aquificaceae bacterium]
MKALFSLFLVFLFGCASAVNSTEKPLFTLLPEDKEVEIGKSYIPYAIEENDGLYPDQSVQDYIKSLGQEIAKYTPRRLPYQFFVVNSENVNAFALPGGPVFVTRGLLLKLNNESELVGVLAHELGHINARHHAKFLEKMYAMDLLFSIGSLLISDKPYGQALLQFGQIGGQLLTLKFSRDQEREADKLGVIYSLKAGYDPQGLVYVFETFKSMEKAKAPEWLLTHPLPQSRIKEVGREIEEIRPSGYLISDSEDFQGIKKIVKGTEVSFEEFYKGKRAYEQKSFQTALSHFIKAIESYDKNYEAYLYMAYILAQEGKVKEALLYSNRAYSIMPKVFSTNYMHGLVLFRAGGHRESIHHLEEAKGLIPDYPDTYYYLGRDYEVLGNVRKAIENYRTAIELAHGKRPWVDDAQERLRRLGG